jgi:hypothetical protein
MGLEARDVLAKSDLYERDGRSQHGFYLSVGREYPYKVRVLANVRSDSYRMGRDDLNELWWNLVKRPLGRDEPDWMPRST